MFVVIIFGEQLWFLCGFGFDDFLELIYVSQKYLENFKIFGPLPKILIKIFKFGA